MVQVTDKGASESLVVTVKIEARLEVGSKANGTCLQCQLLWFFLIRLMLVNYTF